jgi:hypothetical protein
MGAGEALRCGSDMALLRGFGGVTQALSIASGKPRSIAFCLRIGLPENRFALFGPML